MYDRIECLIFWQAVCSEKKNMGETVRLLKCSLKKKKKFLGEEDVRFIVIIICNII